MTELSINSAISAGLTVESVDSLPNFTENDPPFSFHKIPGYYNYIIQSLKWQATNVLSEDFLSNELCYFIERNSRVYFCVDSNNLEVPKAKFAYYLATQSKDYVIVLAGPSKIKESHLQKQLKSRGFILWKAENLQNFLKNLEFKYGTFRNFFPNSHVTLLKNDELLGCKHNAMKVIKYLKLLQKSYVGRLAKVFDALPDVLLDIISSYVLGEFLIEKLYW
ncbi:MAG: hypothetical protein Harvfovirus19_19 [Harvfovirus sp.]|uniref:Uncharacterized protein n=1 Tax=Harvfovirus sp. TaxID=2487768 RepID=A0A3G5A3W8_9VIRU|nr:MAG: hypothetical protein Harvfovirus19_19 [Harvfovirus sp.]